MGCEEFDWDEDVSKITSVKDQDAGRSKLHVVKTSWRDRHRPHLGTSENLYGAITGEGEHIL